MGAKKRRPRKTKTDWTITDWEGWLWKLFSQFIRLRDCIKTTGTVTHGRCVSCKKIYLFGKLQAGHFVSGRTRAILFDERCVHIQCYRCNHKLQGNWPPYYRFMQQEYGQEVIEELIGLWGVDRELTPDWFEQSYQYYEWCVSEMRRTGALIE